MGAAAVPLVMGGIQVAGMVYQYSQQKKQADQAEQFAEYNAGLREKAAAYAEAKGEREAALVRGAAVRAMARAKVAMVSQGMDPGSSGMRDVIEGMAVSSEADAETVRNNAAREAWGLRNDATASLMEGQIAADRANASAVGSLLTGAGYAVNAYGGYKRSTDGLD